MLKKSFLALLVSLFALIIAGSVKAQAATIVLPEGCSWIYYDQMYDSYKIAAFNEEEGVGKGVCPALDKIYGLRLTVIAETVPDTSLIINAESANWDQHDDTVYEKVGKYYVAVLKKENGKALFGKDDSYAQICLGPWGGVDITVVNAEWLDKDGNVLQSAFKIDLSKELKEEKKLVKDSKIKLKLNKKSGKITLKWTTKSETALQGYQVQYSTDGTNFKYLKKNIKPEASSYSYKKGEKGTTYYFKVRGFSVIDGKKVYTPWSGVASEKFTK